MVVERVVHEIADLQARFASALADSSRATGAERARDANTALPDTDAMVDRIEAVAPRG